MECFKCYSEDIKEDRLDPYYYHPEFLELEKKVLKNSKKTLGDYILRISSGATPSRSQDDELYSDRKEGIPFLRVQNITEEGLNLEDVKYITKDVHETSLKRSQVKPGNVLVTITGRIASSCVVPEGFEGNINQHSVVIHTKDLETSKCISTYLNSPVGKKLALRRVSGGSRPALDYKALRSIPVLFNADLISVMDEAYYEKKKLEQEAENLIKSIDDYVLSELGIKVPEFENKSSFKIFFNELDTVFNPEYYTDKNRFFRNPESKYGLKNFGELTTEIKTGLPVRKDQRITGGKYPYYGANGIIGYMDEYTHDGKYLVLGQDGYIGKHHIVEGKFWASNHNWVAKIDEQYNIEYLKTFLDTWDYSYAVTGGVIPKLTKEALMKIKIPIPETSVQKDISTEVYSRIKKAKTLKEKAFKTLNDAKITINELMGIE